LKICPITSPSRRFRENGHLKNRYYLYGMKPIFPTTYSTLCPVALASLIADKYGLENVTCTFMMRGVGDTYHVETKNGRFILRAYRSSHRTKPQIRAELDLLLALKDAHVPVAYPIHDRSGTVIQSLDAAEGKRHVALFSYAPGKVEHTLNENQLRELGRQMARFHKVSASIKLEDPRWNFDLETTLYKPLQLLEPSFAGDPETYTWLQEATKKVTTGLARLDTSGFSTGYCHYDMLPKNFHFDGDSVTFFDFDFMGHGWLVNDLMTFRQQLLLDVHFGKMTQDAADLAFAAFVSAYREVRPLSEQEEAAIPYLSLGFWLFYSGFHTTHDQFCLFIQPGNLKQRFGFVRGMLGRYLG